MMKYKRTLDNRIRNWLESKQKALYVYGLPEVGKKTFIQNVLSECESLFVADCRDKKIQKALASSNLLMGLRRITGGRNSLEGTVMVFFHADECVGLIESTKPILAFGVRLVLVFDYYERTLKKCRFFPLGYVTELEVAPLTFTEYCWANGVKQADIVRYAEMTRNGQELGKMVFQRFQQLWDRYLFVGGYPACVEIDGSGEWATSELHLWNVWQTSISYVGACFGKKAQTVYTVIGKARSGFFDRFVPSRTTKGGNARAYRETIDILSAKNVIVSVPYFKEGALTRDVSLFYTDPGLMRMSMGITKEEDISPSQYHALETGVLARVLSEHGFELSKEHSYSYSPDLICKKGDVEFGLEIKASRGVRLRIDKVLSYSKSGGLYVVSPNPTTSFCEGLKVLPTCMFALMAEGDLL